MRLLTTKIFYDNIKILKNTKNEKIEKILSWTEQKNCWVCMSAKKTLLWILFQIIQEGYQLFIIALKHLLKFPYIVYDLHKTMG